MIMVDLRVINEAKLDLALRLVVLHVRPATHGSGRIAIKLPAIAGLVVKEELACAVGRVPHHLHVTDLLELLLITVTPVVWEAAQDGRVWDVRVH